MPLKAFKLPALDNKLLDKDNFEFEMSSKKRNRLYSQGNRVRRESFSSNDSLLYDADGYLLPPKALTEYIYEEPTYEDWKEFIYKVKSPKKFIYKLFYILKEFLTNNGYFQSLFPKVKEQKPGKDLYLYIGIIQFTILIFLIPFYTAMDKDYTNDSADEFTTNQFSGSMVMAVFIQIAVIIIDRYFYITRSVIKIDKRELKSQEERLEHQSVDDDDSMAGLRRENTMSFMKSWKLNSPKKRSSLSSFDKSLAQSDIGGDDDPENKSISLERNNSHRSIMMKYYFQLFLLVFIHYLIFWYFPTKGNHEIQGHGY